MSTNTLTRCTVAAVTGGRAYALRVSTALARSRSSSASVAGTSPRSMARKIAVLSG